MEAKDTILTANELFKLGVPAPHNSNIYVKQIKEFQAEITWDKAVREVVEFVNDLIIGIEGCGFEERLDGDKGCIVLDMNENQWQAKLKEWGIE